MFLILILVNTSSAQTSAASAKAAQSSAGRSITGRVIGEGGQPFRDASVVAMFVGGATRSARAASFNPITTGEDGRFATSELEPGVYVVLAFSNGYNMSDRDALPYNRPGDNVAISMVKGGVITGRVTDFSGEPAVEAPIRVIRVKDAGNHPIRPGGSPFSSVFSIASAPPGGWRTDDRGIYRVYGLQPGTYQVAAGEGERMSYRGNRYTGNAPTYFPSSTPDTAAEVLVREGAEVTGIDIRYREDLGHRISGKVTGAIGSGPGAVSLKLDRAQGGIREAFSYALPGTANNGFLIDSVADGDYYLTAEFLANEGAASKPRRVKVNGADVTGIEISLVPLGSISGRVNIEPAQRADLKLACKGKLGGMAQEVVLNVHTDGDYKAEVPFRSTSYNFKTTTPDDKGEFKIRFLEAESYHLKIELPGESLYVRAITLPPPGGSGKQIDAARNAIAVKAGERVSGVVVTLSEGAATLSGRVVTAEKEKTLMARMRVHLVPAEPEAGDDVLRFAEAEPESDGSFTIEHIAPGRYWLVARALTDEELSASLVRPLVWDASNRAGLRFEGEATNTPVELKPCREVRDQLLRYTPLTPASKAARKKSN